MRFKGTDYLYYKVRQITFVWWNISVTVWMVFEVTLLPFHRQMVRRGREPATSEVSVIHAVADSEHEV